MTALNIAIFSQLISPTMSEELAPQLRSRGHTVDLIDLSTISPENFIAQPEIQALAKYDLVYYRSGLTPDIDPRRVVELEAFLRAHAIQTVNLHYTEHPQAHSKSYEAQQAHQHGLTIPKSIYINEAFATLSTELGLPFIAKTDQGTQGDGVYMIESETDYNKISEQYFDAQLLFQECIPHDFEYRVFVLEGEMVSLYKKAPALGDFRSNEAQGGKMSAADQQYDNQLSALAKISYSAFNFEIFAVDFMLNKNTNDFFFTEINLNPG